MNNRVFPFLVILFFISCSEGNQKKDHLHTLEATFGQNNSDNESKLDPDWYRGMAEVNVYDLKQNRYNAQHQGEAVMIFVTEDFLKDKQVKNDNYTSKFSTPILKNNQIRRFTTGLYDYSIFSSVFTDISNISKPQTLKISTSSQDWCGQSFLQFNKKERDYKISLYSYFENEADKVFSTDHTITIDELFNLIRINDSLLPIGDIDMIPSSTYALLKHKTIKPYKAKALKINYEGDLTDEDATVYIVKFPELNLKYEIIYLNNKLRPILQWTESYSSAFDGQIRKTIATLKSSQWTDYWSKNTLMDNKLRNQMGLSNYE